MNRQAEDFKKRLETGDNGSGSFFTALGDIIPLADDKNRDLLRRGFPEMVKVYEVFKGWERTEDQIYATVEISAGHVWKVTPFYSLTSADIAVNRWLQDHNVNNGDERDNLSGEGTEISIHEVKL